MIKLAKVSTKVLQMIKIEKLQKKRCLNVSCRKDRKYNNKFIEQ